jgi:hypothetical protein
MPESNPILAFHGVHSDGHVDIITDADVVFSLPWDDARKMARHILYNTRMKDLTPGSEHVFVDNLASDRHSGIVVDYGSLSFLASRLGQRIFFRESFETELGLYAVRLSDIVAHEAERDD